MGGKKEKATKETINRLIYLSHYTVDITVLTSQSHEKDLAKKDHNKTFISMTYGKNNGSGTQQTHSG